MTTARTTKQVYLAYLKGEATLDEVAAAADATLAKFAASSQTKQPPKP